MCPGLINHIFFYIMCMCVTKDDTMSGRLMEDALDALLGKLGS